MNNKDYEINFSYTLDYVSWTCPKCGASVEKFGNDIYDLNCDECGYERQECSLDSCNTTDLQETVYYEEEEED